MNDQATIKCQFCGDSCGESICYTCEEAIIETIEVNEYEFTKEGILA